MEPVIVPSMEAAAAKVRDGSCAAFAYDSVTPASQVGLSRDDPYLVPALEPALPYKVLLRIWGGAHWRASPAAARLLKVSFWSGLECRIWWG